MKIAIAQLNYQVGNLDFNTQKITNAILTAKNQEVDLIIFSELSICGYIPYDLLNYKYFIDDCYKKLEEIKLHCKDIAAIVGLPTKNNKNTRKKLYNSAAFLYDGEIQKLIHKTLIPSFDVINEDRYFEENQYFSIINFKNKKIALTIAEDLWDEEKIYGSFEDKIMFKNAPMEYLHNFNPDFIVNIAAQPFAHNQTDCKKDFIYKNAKKYSIPIININQVGANTELIYEGASIVVDKTGNTVISVNSFKEDLKIFDLDKITNTSQTDNYNKNSDNKYESIYSALILGIKDFFEKSNLKKAVVGLSGGLDSAVVVALLVNAIGKENVDVLLLPTKYSSQHSIDDSLKMVKRCGIKHHIVDIEELRKMYSKTMKKVFENTKEDITEENIQARIRGSVLMAYSNKFGNILLNTSNKSEAAVGYSTMYGDMNGALAVIGDLYKSEVYELADYINQKFNNMIPQNIIDKIPSAELRPNQKDSDSLPDYEILDKILFLYIEQNFSEEEIIKQGLPQEIVHKIIRLVNSSEFKRFQMPPVLKVSQKCFGYGRKMPLVGRY
ncbi:MAG TPA: NAD+ synthase [Bacteroidales bacterium]|nr:NAD+ synthase [Bacteroidales bacterium]